MSLTTRSGTDRGDAGPCLRRRSGDGVYFPDPADRALRLPRLFALLFDADAQAGLRLVAGGGAAATLWRAPGLGKTSLLDLLLHVWPLWRALGGAIGRALTVSSAIDAHLPSDDVWYLHIAGCDPAAQGRGLGRAVVQAGLDRIAGDGRPVYLETANERNLGFYATLGFVVTEAWHVPKGGPAFWSMLRS
ncbi:GNAT family N-acetyltransferase [Sphingomonas sp. Ant H11]|uniref:GNAT family N-acetyltransferase n=1 Tax=Sphingomonas sp. Ant H11 TaxID=1564113 RepID=UPI000ACB2DD0|nr:GNAT family N-acetyltransferase [Sphingomonas sp. Ant H11]